MNHQQHARRPSHHLTTLPLDSMAQLSTPSPLVNTNDLSLIPIDGPVGGLDSCGPWRRKPDVQPGRISLNILPNEVLLYVFQFYRVDTMDRVNETWGWHRLSQVCSRWRHIILGSQHSLGLQLVCTEKTPVRRTLDVWPAFPIIIDYRHAHNARCQPSIRGLDDCNDNDLAVVLEQHARIHRITICGLTCSLLETIASAMLEPFPVLTHLRLESCDSSMPPALPDSLPDGFAPRLQKISLEGIQFSSLPAVLLSATDLVELRLDKIPDSWDLSPETLARALEPLANLSSLSVEFQSPKLRISEEPPPPARINLPALAVLFFKGLSEYFEDFVSRIDAPSLKHSVIKFFNQLLFEISHLPKFIARIEGLRSLNRAEVFFDSQGVGIGLHLPGTTVPRNITLRILCNQSDWQLSSLTQVCHQSSSLLSCVEQLEIRECPSRTREPQWQDKLQWVDLFHPFKAVDALHVPRELGPRIAPVLQELTQPRAAEVLPALKYLNFEDLRGLGPWESMEGGIQQFVAARACAGNPIGVRRWDGKWERDLQWEWNLAREWARNLEASI